MIDSHDADPAAPRLVLLRLAKTRSRVMPAVNSGQLHEPKERTGLPIDREKQADNTNVGYTILAGDSGPRGTFPGLALSSKTAVSSRHSSPGRSGQTPGHLACDRGRQ